MGAGLTGLTAAYALKDTGIDVTLIEGRHRLGGRIWTQIIAGGTPVEAGATWFGFKHTYMVRLLHELEVGYYPQATEGVSLYDAMPPHPPQRFHSSDDEPESYRIKGGSSALIQALAGQLDAVRIHLGAPVQSIDFSHDPIRVRTQGNKEYEADLVVSTLPPRLFAHTVATSPALDASWRHLADQTHTWMSDSIKFFVSYASRFWAEDSFSGMAFSPTGLITEMYDHSSFDGTAHALKGFLSNQVQSLEPSERESIVLNKLAEYFGPQALSPLAYGDVLWKQDPFTSVPELGPLFPHQNNGHEGLRSALFEGRLLMGGSETADQFPGYMDGAVNSGYRIAQAILAQ